MTSYSDESWWGLALVLLLHGGVAAAVIWAPSPQQQTLTPPAIQGVLVPAPPAEQVQRPRAEKKALPPKSEPKAVATPVKNDLSKPVVKPAAKSAATSSAKDQPAPPPGPPSERAVVNRQTVPRPEQNRPPADFSPAPSRPERPQPVRMADRDNHHEGAPVRPPRLDARAHNNPAPAYPRTSRRLREEGTVLLKLLILPDGRVGEVRLARSSGYPRLDQTAIAAVKRWRYQPARQGGVAIAYWYQQPLEFSLN